MSFFNLNSYTFYEDNVQFVPGDDRFPPIAVDDRLDVYINGRYYTTLVMNPVRVREAVIGTLLGDGVVKSMGDIISLDIDLEGKRADVMVVGNHDVKRVYLEDCSILAAKGLTVDSNLRVSWNTILEIYLDFNRRTISVTRGLAMHTSGLYDIVNEKVVIVHDTSRHTSIAKLIGVAIEKGLDFKTSVAITTGRASADMVIKFANMKVPIVISTRGPLYSGFTAAATLKITLVVYIRRGDKIRGLTILTYPERITGYKLA